MLIKCGLIVGFAMIAKSISQLQHQQSKNQNKFSEILNWMTPRWTIGNDVWNYICRTKISMKTFKTFHEEYQSEKNKVLDASPKRTRFENLDLMSTESSCQQKVKR